MIGILVILFVPVISTCQEFHNPNVVADFEMTPNPVCAKDSVHITNLSRGASTYRWSFSTGNLDEIPFDQSFASLNYLLENPIYTTLVRTGNDFYSFITDAGTGMVVRNYHGNKLIYFPDTFENIVQVDSTGNRIRGIQVKNDNGNWYGFIVRKEILVRIDFGDSLGNDILRTTHIGTHGNLITGEGLVICRQGNEWLGFCTDSYTNQVVRFNFGPSLDNPYPDIAPISFQNSILVNPGQCVIAKENDSLFMFVCNSSTQSIARLRFGDSWLNPPRGEKLDNIGTLNNVAGISLTEDCQSFTGFVINEHAAPNVITRLKFPNGLGGEVVGTDAGLTGTLDFPDKISEIVRQGDTIFALVTNPNTSSLSLLYFPGFGRVNPAESTLEKPPVVYYSVAGTYTARLTVDAGLPTEQSVCRQIVVSPAATVDLGNDRTICTGSSTSLVVGVGYSHYTWSTGDTTRKITVSQPGTYTVQVENAGGCIGADSIKIAVADTMHSSMDTSICHGERYFAGGRWRHSSGTYSDIYKSVYGCDSILTTNLVVKDSVSVALGNDTLICHGIPIELSVHVDSATYLWQDASTDSVFTVTQAGKYWVTALKQGCAGSDTIVVSECPPDASGIWIPNAFSPNGDGLNDVFKPVCQNIVKFHMEIFDRWGTMIFTTSDPLDGWTGQKNGSYYPAGVYTYRIDYEGVEAPGVNQVQKGTMMIVR